MDVSGQMMKSKNSVKVETGRKIYKNRKEIFFASLRHTTPIIAQNRFQFRQRRVVGVQTFRECSADA